MELTVFKGASRFFFICDISKFKFYFSVILWLKFVQTPSWMLFIVFLRKNFSSISKKSFICLFFILIHQYLHWVNSKTLLCNELNKETAPLCYSPEELFLCLATLSIWRWSKNFFRAKYYGDSLESELLIFNEGVQQICYSQKCVV